jgi:hypothetical protein
MGQAVSSRLPTGTALVDEGALCGDPPDDIAPV